MPTGQASVGNFKVLRRMLGEGTFSILEIEKGHSQKPGKNAARDSKGRSRSRAYFCICMANAGCWYLAIACCCYYCARPFSP